MVNDTLCSAYSLHVLVLVEETALTHSADNFTPTLEGPYFRGALVHHQGKYGHHGHHREGDSVAVGGKTSIHQHVLQKRVAATGQTGEVTADDQQNDSLYLCPVQIGTPAQTLNLDFDTGSSDLWVWSTELPTATQTQGKTANHAIFNPAKSSTYKKTTGSTWKISYGDGSSASGGCRYRFCPIGRPYNQESGH